MSYKTSRNSITSENNPIKSQSILNDQSRRMSQILQQDVNFLGRSFVSSGSYFQSNMQNYKHKEKPAHPITQELSENPFFLTNEEKESFENDLKYIHNSENLHKETALMADNYDDVRDSLDDGDEDEIFGSSYNDSLLSGAANPSVFPFSPISSNIDYGSIEDRPKDEYILSENLEEINATGPANFKDIAKFKSPAYLLSQTVKYFPSAFLGVLLNLLDALSYGMIVFPITEPIFSQLGSAGLSMFYISSIVSQLCYSCGFSLFGSSIGSEMIEITPFFHKMAMNVFEHYAEKKNAEKYQFEIITTTLICFVGSSLLTGAVFYSLGKMKLGKIVGFFPRHILIGCIGSVGYFLIITGLEVSLQIPKVLYNFRFWLELLPVDYNYGKISAPILLTILLIYLQKKFNNNSLVLPAFYVAALFGFHFIVALMPNLNLPLLRDHGWIFSTTDATDSLDFIEPLTDSVDIGNSWYSFYKLFKWKMINWNLVVKNIPTMSALAFFGILHVPINVPALAVTLNCDRYDIDQELIAHGWSNFLSGVVGSIPNYLVYTNSVLFIRAGADSRFAGVLLAVLTAIIMFIGPVIIGFIPICIVGSLIFLLGYELLKEALSDTFGILGSFEYITVLLIVLVSAIFDFVMGIIAGLIIACFHFLVNSANLQSINGEYDGIMLQSTVNRDVSQTELLNRVGDQIYILKLQNLLFFGTILSIEEKINNMLEREGKSGVIKYLILDFKNIKTDQIDYSAAEGFNRIKRFLKTKNITLIISSINDSDTIYTVFSKVGLLEDVELFRDLNSALEWCENKYLHKYKLLKHKERKKIEETNKSTVSDNSINRLQERVEVPSLSNNELAEKNPFTHGKRGSTLLFGTTPRNDMFFKAATNVIQSETKVGKNLQDIIKLKNSGSKSDIFLNDNKNKKFELKDEDQCLSLFLQSFRAFITEKEFQQWSSVGKYFERQTLKKNEVIPNDNCVILVESGIIKISYSVTDNARKTESVYETLSRKCAYGKITNEYYKIAPEYNDTVYAETDSIIWILNSEQLSLLKKKDTQLFIEVLTLISALNQFRYKKLLRFTIASS
ncbi:hypothetical protein QEN19_000159 [Hanseniaspora menglaensis]